MRFALSFVAMALALLAGAASPAEAPSAEARKAEYVHAVTRGGGLLPWQEAEVSEAERSFRAEMEARKSALLKARVPVAHPVLHDNAAFVRARARLESEAWAERWVNSQVALADYALAQPDTWLEEMLPLLTPAHGYGFTCPACVGEVSQEETGYSLVNWSYREPDHFSCRACGQVYPDPAYPETAVLELPRSGQRIHYYLNEAQRVNPEDRSGAQAWHWAGHPINVSFSGIIRERKISFMGNMAEALGFAYAFTENPEYAIKTRALLLRYAEGYQHWRYRDYWDTYADCDPLYAAWHDQALPLEFKRHLSESAYSRDTPDKAAMLQTYWGAGRVHTSTDAISGLRRLLVAYDLTRNAVDAAGAPVWDEAASARVERDLFLEYIFGAEPFLGGATKAENANNKAPRVYHVMAAAGMVLGLPDFVDVALRGYEHVRDASFLYDGASSESPSYTDMYLSQLAQVPETLHGFAWPEGFAGRAGTVDYYAEDTRLRLMYRGLLWSLLPDGAYVPLSDTIAGNTPSAHLLQIGAKRYPEYFAGVLPIIHPRVRNEYALFHLEPEEAPEAATLDLPETYFPAWKTALLRHGSGPDAALLALPLNPPGGHRHRDNLALYYQQQGRAMLGDLGYVGDMPLNAWIRSTFSHNLVIVDDAEQEFSGRRTDLRLLATSPLASVVEASSNAYPQCTDYTRRVVLLKGPGDSTLAVDRFTVRGGSKHTYRVYSELASSTDGGALHFDGLDMPEEPPLPEIGASLAREDIFGLRDLRSATPTGPWQATWRDKEGAYRLWMLGEAARVEAGNGPGQRTRAESGRRVRLVDTIREGEALESRFLAVHEPGTSGGALGVENVELLDAAAAGPDAAALRLHTAEGGWLVLHDFAQPHTVHGVEFQGTLAVLQLDPAGRARAYFTVGAVRLQMPGASLDDPAPELHAKVHHNDDTTLHIAPPDTGWPVQDAQTQAWVLVQDAHGWTGHPRAQHSPAPDTIQVKDYPLPEVTELRLHAVRYKAALPQ